MKIESPSLSFKTTLAADVPTVDFSGWPMVVHKDMPEAVALAICEAIEGRKALMPTDNFKPLDMAQLCANDAEAPYDVPLHPGARKFYSERGYLKEAGENAHNETRLDTLFRSPFDALRTNGDDKYSILVHAEPVEA